MTSDAKFIEKLQEATRCLGITLTSPQFMLMHQHYQRILAANQQFNLTRITDPADAAIRLYGDSLAPIAWAQANGIEPRTVLDVGTGAGFPAIPLAILRPNWQVTAADSTGKKTHFVAECATRLPLSNLRAVRIRAGSDTHTNRYDLMTFKAVGPPHKCLQMARELVNPGGHVAVFQTSNTGDGKNTDHPRADGAQAFRQVEPFDYHIRVGDQDWKMQLLIFRRV